MQFGQTRVPAIHRQVVIAIRKPPQGRKDQYPLTPRLAIAKTVSSILRIDKIAQNVTSDISGTN